MSHPYSSLVAEAAELRIARATLRDELAAWQSCAADLAADLRGCSQCCDVSDCVCRASLAEFERLTKSPTP